MKSLHFLSFILLLIIMSCSTKNLTLTKDQIVSGKNLVPPEPGKTPGYWCTWSAQNYSVDSLTIIKSLLGIEGHSIIARNLTEERVFGKDGWAKEYSPVHSDLYLLFDLGWDIHDTMNFDNSRWKLGSQVVATDKFPSCTGTPSERLKKLNDLCKKAGWRGAAIWIPSQGWEDGKNNRPLSDQQMESYFRERARWAHDAGIEYWKVDYGSRGSDIEFRKLVTRIAKEEAPGLWVEQCRGGGPLNDFDCPWDCKSSSSGEFAKWCNGEKLNSSINLLGFSQILRTYDVTPYLSIPTTLDRVGQILNGCAGKDQITGILNCEDEPYIAAALNCMTGILRHSSFLTVKGYDYDPLVAHKRCDEVVRAVRWQRIAPATGAGLTGVILDSVRLTDTWKIVKGASWVTWLTGSKVKQSAPARISRNMSLPLVKCDSLQPFVISSKHLNGAVTVATLTRHDATRGFYFPLADVSVLVEDFQSPVAVFGRYKSLSIKYKKLPVAFKVYAQDLAGDVVYDISGLIERKRNTLKLSGKLIETAGLSAASPGDLSDPGLILKIMVETPIK